MAPAPAHVFWTGISAAAPTDAWAVGNANAKTYLEHWNGGAWSASATLPPTTALNAVFARSSDDVWAVGANLTSGTTAIEHRSSAGWTAVPSPSPGTGGGVPNQFNGVTALSSTDAWAVGYYIQGSAFVPLTEHWNGSVWAVVPMHTTAAGGLLYSVSGSSSTDVWAVGQTTAGLLLEHWDGAKWTEVGLSSGNLNGSSLTSVTATSPKDAWAVGFVRAQFGFNNTVTVHWNGSTWTRVAAPNPGAYGNPLKGVTQLASGSVVAVGQSWISQSQSVPLIEQWNGSAWTVQPPANSLKGNLSAVTSLPDGHLWAAGSNIEQRCP